MNRPESPSTALRAPSPPNGGEGQDEGERFMESLLSLLRTHWDHEPDWHPSPCPLPARRGEGGRRPGEGRFMESFHGFATAHLDHERWGETPSSPDLPATGIS